MVAVIAVLQLILFALIWWGFFVLLKWLDEGSRLEARKFADDLSTDDLEKYLDAFDANLKRNPVSVYLIAGRERIAARIAREVTAKKTPRP